MKKGFILVELLAVIVILAIILVIAVPQINKTIKQTRVNAVSSTAKVILAKAEEQVLENEALDKSEALICKELTKMSDDYGSCVISYDSNNKIDIRIKGKENSKFEGIVCTGTKNNIECDQKATGAMFLTGSEVNVKMKQLANPGVEDITKSYFDSNITAILHSTTEPSDSNKQSANIVSTSDSKYPIYMWYDNGTIYWWSIDEYPYLNADATHMFRTFNNLSDITGLRNFDASKVTTLRGAFSDNIALTNLNGIETWDTSI